MMELKKINKKGQTGGLAASILALGIAAIVLILFMVITQEIRDTTIVAGAAGSAERNDTAFITANKTVVGLGTFGDFWVIIVLAIVAAVVIGIIFGAFGGIGRTR